ncbi:alpha-ketoglutarate-dependent dioxygenase alkB-like protein [Trichonephila clavipes]|nr:alpha-ketoglutarate-dependent dioxygenase alkB-like protein [Trichonephila clavipes]
MTVEEQNTDPTIRLRKEVKLFFQEENNSKLSPHTPSYNAELRAVYLAVTAKSNRQSTTLDLFRQLTSVTGTTVSRQTLYNRLGQIGLYARRPVRSCRLILNGLLYEERQIPVTTKRISLNDTVSVVPDCSFFLGGVDILGSRTDLHVQIGTMMGQNYRDVILEQHVRLFRCN